MGAKEFEVVLSEAETLLDRLRALYEQWFQGVERLEPTVPRKEMDRRVLVMRRTRPRNTALRFRFNRLVQKYTTYQIYWKRIARQIEEGTYRRDLMKARKRRTARREALRAGQDPVLAWEVDVDVAMDDDPLMGSAEVDAPLAALDPARIPAAYGEEAGRPGGSSPFAAPPAPPRAAASERRDTPAAPPPSFSDAGGSPAPSPARALPDDRPTSRAPPPPCAVADIAIPAHRLPREAIQPGPVERSFAPPRAAPGRAPARRHPPPPPGMRPPPGPAAARAGTDDIQIRRVYDRYIEARRNNNERVDNLEYQSVAKSIKELIPKLRARHKGKRIDFEVVVKDGKVGIKPVAK